ncbi:MAG: thioredoxin family protein [Chloroflexi bacterium]|nr:thioredoxin family protein [Chloroflexota bacterium]
MAVTRERFNQGLTYEEYKASMTRNRDQLEENERNLELSDADLAPFRSLPETRDVLVLAEDWCADVIANLPILGRISEESGNLNLRVFVRDQNKDLTSQFMNGPYESIPVFAFFDKNFNQVGLWIERPKSLTELRDQKRSEIYAGNPEFGSPDAPVSELPEETRTRLQRAIQQMRGETAEFGRRQVVRELGAIVRGEQRVGGNVLYDPNAVRA